MVEQPRSKQFDKVAAAPLSMSGAIARAKSEMREISDLPVESVIRCGRSADGGWEIALELVESPARMGDNDYLAAYQVQIAADGAISGLSRLGRYRREDGGPT